MTIDDGFPPDVPAREPIGVTEIPFHLRYDLTRRHRLAELWAVWGWIPVIPAFFAYLMIWGAVHYTAWLIPLALLCLLILTGPVTRIVNVIVHRAVPKDLIVQENDIAILIRGERWHLFLDGVTGVERTARDLWTLWHRNGTILSIPAAAITDDQLEHLRRAAARGRTPEEIRRVVERGRRIQALTERTRLRGKA